MNWTHIFDTLEEAVGRNPLPSVSEIAGGKRDPFRILISTLLSLRTKDEVTYPASLRLFKEGDTPEALLNMSRARIEELIYPVGFYKTKALRIHEISRILLEQYGGTVPADRDSLLAFPGVGLKTANLVLGLGFNQPYICVDTHVHRISNRLGWVRTKTPEETEKALSVLVPPEGMVRINELMVLFGQRICRPVSPYCSQCPLLPECPQNGVDKKR